MKYKTNSLGHLTFLGGTKLSDVIETALDVAQKEERAQTICFNSSLITVSPRETVEMIYDRYATATIKKCIAAEITPRPSPFLSKEMTARWQELVAQITGEHLG